MSTIDKAAAEAGQILFRKAGEYLEAMIAERNVNFAALERVEQTALLEKALARTSIDFPNIDTAKLLRGFRAFTHPRTMAAFRAVEALALRTSDAFALASGPDCAIALAAVGIPVAPIDKRDGRLLAPASRDLDEVAATFDGLRTALVGYSTCEAGFYNLQTDSTRTLRQKLLENRRYSQLKETMVRAGVELPPMTYAPFKHWGALVSRQPGDKVASFNDLTNDPSVGSVMFSAGWMEDGQCKGGTRPDGFAPASLRLIATVVADPQVAYWLTEEYADPPAKH